MRLLDFYSRRYVIGLYPLSEFKDIIYSTSKTRIEPLTTGKYLIDKKNILNCVSEYYQTTAKETVKKKSNPFINCQETKRMFKLDDISGYDCKNCHMKCHQNFIEGRLLHKENINKKKRG